MELGQLAKLDTLKLHTCDKISGTIPPEMGTLGKLTMYLIRDLPYVYIYVYIYVFLTYTFM